MNAFQSLLHSGNTVLIDFTAEWCGPCQTMAPVLKEAKQRLGDAVTIIKVDIDRNPGAATAFSVQGVPTFVLIRDGKTLWRQSGAMPLKELLNYIQPHLKK